MCDGNPNAEGAVTARLFTFIGVTTGASAMMRIFPRWRDLLGLGADVEIRGRDLPLDAPARRYREVVQDLKDDPSTLGALVTTHKLNLYRAGHDLFDEVDEYAQLLGEVSCIGKREGRLRGWAKDPVSAGEVLQALLGAGYFGRTGAQVLCLGTGGAGSAIILALMLRPAWADRPRRIIATDRSAERLDSLRTLHRRLGSDVPIDYVRTDGPDVSDTLVAGLSPHALVINATGQGKDSSGSPLTDAVRFPAHSIAWDLNYRGELTFLHQARSQAAASDVRAEDGWQYFILGWAGVIAEVFERPISGDELHLLAQDAALTRPSPADRDRVAEDGAADGDRDGDGRRRQGRH